MPKFTPASSRYISDNSKFWVSLTVGLPIIGLAIGIFQWYSGLVGVFELCILLIFYLATMIGLEMGFHRLLSHRSFKTTSLNTTILAALGSMAAQGSPFHWISYHRLHHKHTDNEKDPHSPCVTTAGNEKNSIWKTLSTRCKGVFHAHIGWLFEHRTVNHNICRDLVANNDINKINRSYPVLVLIGLVLPGFIGMFVYESIITGFLQGFLWGGLIRVCLVQHAVWAINSIGHTFGSQPFQQSIHQVDNSRNNTILALPC